MTVERVLPEDPLAFIQRCVQRRQLYWTYHINMRLQGRFISRQHILDAVDTYEIVESYPEDKYLPSYLVYATVRAEVFHVLFAVDVSAEHMRVITAYRPDPEAWEAIRKRGDGRDVVSRLWSKNGKGSNHTAVQSP
jgi:hypothetical protein